MKKLLLFLFVGLLLTGCGNGVVDEAREAERIRTLDRYMNSIETTASTYSILNPEIKDIKICVGKGPATTDCIIDATEAGIKSRESAAEKIVNHAGEPVICESAQYDTKTYHITITNCTVGDDTKNVYSGNTTDGIKKVK